MNHTSIGSYDTRGHGVAEPAPQTRLESAMHRLADTISDVSNRVSALHSRAEPLLQPAFPKPDAQVSGQGAKLQSAPPPASPTVLAVERLTEHLLASVDQMDDLLQRLEA